jgi:copper transport protein
MRRLLAALATAAAVLAIGPVTVGPAAPIALAHAQLLSSTPGAGELVAQAPSEIRLVFSEPLDPRFSSADVLNAAGQAVVDHAGRLDAVDATTLVVPLPQLAFGAYTVNWRSLSAADGHQANGFVTFGVGSVDQAVVGATSAGQSGQLHGGHDTGVAFVEVQTRSATDLGFLLAFGLLVIGFAVLRPTLGIRPTLASAQRWSLLGGVAGGLGLGALAGVAPGVDPAGFLLGTRPGQLILARTTVGLIGIVASWWLARRGRTTGAVTAAGAAGGAALVLLALAGHASAFASPAPVAAIVVHLGAVGVWLAGLGTLLLLAFTVRDHGWVRMVVSRFSALALVSIALVAATGLYSAWIETGSVIAFDTPYQVNLVIKAGLVLAALAIGAVNYLTGGVRKPPPPPTRGGTAKRRRLVAEAEVEASVGFGLRIALESLIAVGILLAAANLASGSPPGREDPTSLAPAAAADVSGIDLALLPARPGPNRLTATWTGPGTRATAAEVRLDRLDTTTGEAVIKLASVSGVAGRFAAPGVVLPPGSSWDATVVLRDIGGAEVGRRRFTFGFDATGLAIGRAASSIDVGIAIAIALLAAALVAGGFAVAGGSPPLVERTTGRRALLAGACAGGVLAVVALVWRVVP